MAKNKNKKRISSEKVNNKRKSVGGFPKSPFEVHINKEKLKVLGRKTKHTKGFPGLSRAKAIDKRKNTLLAEYMVRNKSNVFKDRRIAEHDPTLSVEEKQMARFAAIRQKAHKKKSIFNLGDDDNSLYPDEEEILTHKGQALSEIEKFEDPRSDDEIDDEDDGKLDKKFVEQMHFGGGFLKNTEKEGAKSHKDLIDQIIAESKKRKAEKKQTKEELNELTDKLDAEWKDLMPLMNVKIRKRNEQEESKADEFDKIMLGLKFEARGIPSDPVKSEDQIANEEKEKLERLEKERLDRMMGVNDNESSMYRCGDDLDDNLVYESLSEDENNGIEVNMEDLEENDEDLDKNSEDQNQCEVDEEEVEEGDESTGNEESEVDTDSEDDLSDLKAETSDSEDDEVDMVKHSIENKSQIQQKSNKETEKEEKDLPSTFTFPEDDEKLRSLLSNHSPENQGIIVERIIKSYHISLLEENKEKLGLLFKYILQYINDITSEITEESDLKNAFSILDQLAPHLFDLSQMNQKTCHDSVREVIKEKFYDYFEKCKVFPDLEVLFFLKLVSLLFPTSDFRHKIVTPCFIFIEKMLTSCRVKSKRHISYGLFLSTLVLEYTTLSKRYMPGCLNFLGGIIHMAVPKSTVKIIKVLPPFKSLSSDLVLQEDGSPSSCSLKMEVGDLLDGQITDSFRVRSLYTAVKITREFFVNFKEYASNLEIFESIYQYCKLINLVIYPEDVESEIKSFISCFEHCKKEKALNYLQMEAAKPKLLRLLEPNIIEVYDRKMHRVQSREKAERDKLIHKLKREKKGALREIRRDNAFLGRVKISEQIRGDTERKEKVKRIYAEANIQQSELNALDRKRKKK